MKIFFSHSSTDKALVREVKSKMYDFLDIWLDEKELIIGESLEGEINKAIDNADYMVLFISEKALESDWVNKEIELALEKEKMTDKPFILPILLGECTIPNSLDSKLYLKLRTQNKSEIMYFCEDLNKEIFKLLVKYPILLKYTGNQSVESNENIKLPKNQSEAEKLNDTINVLGEFTRNQTQFAIDEYINIIQEQDSNLILLKYKIHTNIKENEKILHRMNNEKGYTLDNEVVHEAGKVVLQLRLKLSKKLLDFIKFLENEENLDNQNKIFLIIQYLINY